MKRLMQTSDSTHADDGRQRGSEHHRDIDANRRQRQGRGRSKALQRAGSARAIGTPGKPRQRTGQPHTGQQAARFRE
jgi:hypothetical protein